MYTIHGWYGSVTLGSPWIDLASILQLSYVDYHPQANSMDGDRAITKQSHTEYSGSRRCLLHRRCPVRCKGEVFMSIIFKCNFHSNHFGLLCILLHLQTYVQTTSSWIGRLFMQKKWLQQHPFLPKKSWANWTRIAYQLDPYSLHSGPRPQHVVRHHFTMIDRPPDRSELMEIWGGDQVMLRRCLSASFHYPPKRNLT